MKAIMVMFDSLNRHMLPCYGGQMIKAPNFQRLADRAVTYDNAYVGSMPCIPARREMHTGRYNFLHRTWGPLEPFDDSAPELLKRSGIHTHLVTDHQHYFEDGAGTYHTRYSTWEFFRGQEGDAWKGVVADPDIPEVLRSQDRAVWRQDWVNRPYTRSEAQRPQTQTFNAGLEFIETNADEDNWFVQIETFDPHEPFDAPDRFRELYPDGYNGPHFDWPIYGPVTEDESAIAHVKREYAALVSMCDYSLGRVLDAMDRHDLWDDTMLIVCCDHGFLLAEHGYWAKNIMPWYSELARTPLLLWDPRTRRRGERAAALVQTIDFPATLLEFFGVPRPRDMQGVPLPDVGADNGRAAALFGAFGGHVNVTDGRYVYMRAPVSADPDLLYEYTVMPLHIFQPFATEELARATLAPPFGFTKDVPLLRVPGRPWGAGADLQTLLFDLETDPRQAQVLRDRAVELRMAEAMVTLMRETEAPPEQFERLGLPATGEVEESYLVLAP